MRSLRVVAAAAAVAALLLPSPASAEPVPAQSAAAFRDSIGVNTHIVYFDTAYGDWSRLVGKLDELGVDHLRDWVYANPARRDWNEIYYRAVELAAAHGMRFSLMMGTPGWSSGTLDQLAAVVRGRLRPAVDAIEGPNEYDIFHGGSNWPSELRSYQQALDQTVKADPLLRDLPVIGPSLGSGDSWDKLGELGDSVDAGNVHPYDGGQAPSPAHLAGQRDLASRVSGTKPLYATEGGFQNALAATQGQPPVSEDVAASYMLRMYLENFRAGIVRTYAYELIDEKPDPSLTDPEQHFGMLRNDYSEKPAFVALKRMLELVGRPDPVPTAPLELTLTGDTQGVQHLLLQQSDRRYTLVLWQAASQWDTQLRRELTVAPRTAQLTLPADANVTLTRPAAKDNATIPVGTKRTLSLDVPGDPLVVQLDFGGPPPATQPPVAQPPVVKPPVTRPPSPVVACPRSRARGGLILRRAGAVAHVRRRPSRQRPVRVELCVQRSGQAVIELGRATRHGRLSRVLSSRRLSLRAGRSGTVDLTWSSRASRSVRRSGGGPALRVRYLPSGARQTVVLERRLRASFVSGR